MSDLVGTPQQVAEALETSYDSVLYLKQHRGLPFVMVNRQTWVVPWTALDEWLTDQAWGQGRSVSLAGSPPPADTAKPAPLVASMDEAAHLLRVSKRLISRFVADGTLKSIKLGSRRVIPYIELERYVATQKATPA